MKELNEENIIDTLELAKKKFLGQSVSLDSLCKRYNIDITERNVHGALKDAKLLSAVYLELIGGRQSKLKFTNINDTKDQIDETILNVNEYYKNMPVIASNRIDINPNDYKKHLESIENIKNSIWKKFDN